MADIEIAAQSLGFNQFWSFNMFSASPPLLVNVQVAGDGLWILPNHISFNSIIFYQFGMPPPLASDDQIDNLDIHLVARNSVMGNTATLRLGANNSFPNVITLTDTFDDYFVNLPTVPFFGGAWTPGAIASSAFEMVSLLADPEADVDYFGLSIDFTYIAKPSNFPLQLRFAPFAFETNSDLALVMTWAAPWWPAGFSPPPIRVYRPFRVLRTDELNPIAVTQLFALAYGAPPSGSKLYLIARALSTDLQPNANSQIHVFTVP